MCLKKLSLTKHRHCHIKKYIHFQGTVCHWCTKHLLVGSLSTVKESIHDKGIFDDLKYYHDMYFKIKIYH